MKQSNKEIKEGTFRKSSIKTDEIKWGDLKDMTENKTNKLIILGTIKTHDKKVIKLYPEDWEGDDSEVSEELCDTFNIYDERNSTWIGIETNKTDLPKFKKTPSSTPASYEKVRITIERLTQKEYDKLIEEDLE